MNKVQISQVLKHVGRKVADQNEQAILDEDEIQELEQLRLEVYDIIKTIKDPEEPGTLEELEMITEDLVSVRKENGLPSIRIEWAPTNPECKCALTIALCIRTKLFQQLSVQNAKIDIYIKEGKHSIKDQIDKQVNDKERVLAAMENENVVAVIADLIQEPKSH
ncbi:hypothetical protein FGO68_gene1533 [Halteria grandinella]|uniref:MIP18 family-like domain-containing protein n=1 Tax=Halteria grandinella TaxID=5974 RepID=A0A8J8NHB0_HALGN|nr:hypothetical protein FGO68_gene1533 [Halteria grandinella]